MNNSRALALKIIQQIDKGLTAQQALEQSALTGSERRFCADLVYGFLRTRLRLSLELQRYLPQLHKLPYLLVIILSLGAYSILFQDRAQGYAVVNETVKLAKAKFGQKLANLVNAVLRKLASQKDVGSWDENAQAEYWSIPEGIASLWRDAYGPEIALAMMRRSFQRPWGGFRINRLHPLAAELQDALGRCHGVQTIGPWGVAFPPGKVPAAVCGHSLEDLLQIGAISRQAAGSMLVLEKLAIISQWRTQPIWDCCCGVGGKSLLLLEAGLNVLLTSDISLTRLRNMRLECQRLGLPVPFAMRADASFPPLQSWDGNILIDAPCSGLGVLARRPDIKGRFNLVDMASLINIQSRILAAVAAMLLPGRELVYITCTNNPAENELQIASVQAKFSFLKQIGQWQTTHDHPWLEGMFGCRLRRAVN